MDLMWLYTLHSWFNQTRQVYNIENVNFKYSVKKLLFDRDQFFPIIKILLYREVYEGKTCRLLQEK